MLPRDSEGIERREVSSLARRFHIELRADPPNYFRRVGTARTLRSRDPRSVPVTALIAERGEYGHTVCPYSPTTRGTIEANPIGERKW